MRRSDRGMPIPAGLVGCVREIAVRRFGRQSHGEQGSQGVHSFRGPWRLLSFPGRRLVAVDKLFEPRAQLRVQIRTSQETLDGLAERSVPAASAACAGLRSLRQGQTLATAPVRSAFLAAIHSRISDANQRRALPTNIGAGNCRFAMSFESVFSLHRIASNTSPAPTMCLDSSSFSELTRSLFACPPSCVAFRY